MSYDYEKQWPGLPIKFLILSAENFIVFIDHDIDVDWATADKYSPQDPKAHNSILNRAALLESRPCDGLSESIRLNFKRMVGEAIARSLQHDYKNAEQMLLQAEKFVTARNDEIARSWYLGSSAVTASAFVLIGLGLWSFRGWFKVQIGELPFFLIISSVAGAAGALLSVVLRMGKSNVDGLAGRRIHFLEGGFRIVAGTISASVVSLAVYAGVFLPIFTEIKKQNIAMVLAGLVAGISERLVPSLIEKVQPKGKPSLDENTRTKA